MLGSEGKYIFPRCSCVSHSGVIVVSGSNRNTFSLVILALIISGSPGSGIREEVIVLKFFWR